MELDGTASWANLVCALVFAIHSVRSFVLAVFRTLFLTTSSASVLTYLLYFRSQIANIGIRPYTQKVMAIRAKKLADAFPQYDAKIVADFCESITFYDEKHGIKLGGALRD